MESRSNLIRCSAFQGDESVLFGGPGSAKRHRLNGPGSLQSASGGPDADSPPSGLARSASPVAAGAALSPPPLPITVGGNARWPRWPEAPGGEGRSASMDNHTENNNKVRLKVKQKV